MLHLCFADWSWQLLIQGLVAQVRLLRLLTNKAILVVKDSGVAIQVLVI